MRIPRMAYTLVLLFAALGAARADDLKLKIIALNDLHGNLQSPGKFRAKGKSPNVDAGGIDYLAGYVAQLKRENPNHVVVAAGDLIGASALVSALFHDEDTVEALNRVGLEFSSVGNHEFDKGKRELLRMQSGGCSTEDQNTCQGAASGTPVPFEGAKFHYLAANVFDTAAHRTLFPAYAIKNYEGVRVAFIGLTLRETPTIVTPSGVAGLRFDDEASTINAVIQRLRKQGVANFVVLIHQGGRQTPAGTLDINACEGDLAGTPIESIVRRLDDHVDLVISGHTHQPYICQLPNRAGRKIYVTSASAYGRVLTDIDVRIDRNTRRVTDVSAKNILVERTTASGVIPDATLKSLVDHYAALAAPIANRVVGSVTAEISRTPNFAGEAALGDVIADAQLAATQAAGSGGAVVSFMNEGGIRADIPYVPVSPAAENGAKKGEVTYNELFTVQPFGNSLVTMTLTGAQIKILLEEQFKGCSLGAPSNAVAPPETDRPLQVSDGFTYTWSPGGAVCAKVDAGSIKIHRAAVEPSAKYRVTVNSFLADGGDQFWILQQGTVRLGGPQDIDAMLSYFEKHQPLAPGDPHRITVEP
ncbi:MAG TPA: 5'-nucleotidase C-terminal domain-containing protein [Candidatus Acidoferrales bacterium]|nr:5'-nucleotidase C-terminal domain-containing protein [Candidatus Acidoferrales bacterium]